ncbi:sulfatase-like hydrolase/transferase [bacterium AH-315-P07]|nr:sulfatase-like hydrolase/transferase [bacterium AH-315-P07]
MKLLKSLIPILCVFTCMHAQAKQPNVILIMADDLGYETLGTYGTADYKTPVLDKLAATGMKFNHCYSQPLCTPSRVQIMTGRYNFRNYTAFGILPKTEVTFGHLLQDAGYATAIAGKWQLWGTNTKIPEDHGTGFLPDEAGFDEYCLWQVKKVKKQGERYADPFIDLNGEEITFKNGYGPDVFTDFILDFIEEKKDDPFFVYYPMALTHDPFVPTPDSPEWDGDRMKKSNKHFKDMVEYMDKVVGQIVAKLDDLGLRDDTLVIFTGDNGTKNTITTRMLDGRRIRGDKGKPTDAGTRVPLIANWPGVIKPGQINNNLIDFSDFLPTITELTSAKLPTDRTLDGRSFLHQLKGEPGDVREWVFCHYDPKWGDRPKSIFARDHRYKLYADGRFFDIKNDVLEKTPLEKAELSKSTRKLIMMLQSVLDEMR